MVRVCIALLALFIPTGANNVTIKSTQIDSQVIQGTASFLEDNNQGPSSLATGSAELLGQLINGQEVDIASLAGVYIPALLGLANPILGGAAAIVVSFLSGVFGGDAAPDVYTVINQQVPLMIREELIRNQLGGVQRKISDIVSGGVFWSSVANSEGSLDLQKAQMANFETDLNNERGQVFGACVDGNSNDCDEWRKSASVVHEVLFANIHLNIMIENAYLYRGNSGTVQLFASRIYNMGNTYADLLDESLRVFSEHRDDLFEPVQRDVDARYGIILEGGHDHWLSLDLVSVCGYKRTWGSEQPPMSTIESCVNNHLFRVRLQLSAIRRQVEDVRRIALAGSLKNQGTVSCDVFEGNLWVFCGAAPVKKWESGAGRRRRGGANSDMEACQSSYTTGVNRYSCWNSRSDSFTMLPGNTKACSAALTISEDDCEEAATFFGLEGVQKSYMYSIPKGCSYVPVDGSSRRREVRWNNHYSGGSSSASSPICETTGLLV